MINFSKYNQMDYTKYTLDLKQNILLFTLVIQSNLTHFSFSSYHLSFIIYHLSFIIYHLLFIILKSDFNLKWHL